VTVCDYDELYVLIDRFEFAHKYIPSVFQFMILSAGFPPL
jgi:hypothetical protein